jgi:hypothetical protein
VAARPDVSKAAFEARFVVGTGGRVAAAAVPDIACFEFPRLFVLGTKGFGLVAIAARDRTVLRDGPFRGTESFLLGMGIDPFASLCVFFLVAEIGVVLARRRSGNISSNNNSGEIEKAACAEEGENQHQTIPCPFPFPWYCCGTANLCSRLGTHGDDAATW